MGCSLAGTGERGERSIIEEACVMPLVTHVSHLVSLISRKSRATTSVLTSVRTSVISSHLFDVYSTLLSNLLTRERKKKREKERKRKRDTERKREREREKWSQRQSLGFREQTRERKETSD